MKVVLDTNVFVSGVFFNGPPYQILQAWRSQIVEMIVSPEILDEHQRVGEILAEEHPRINFRPILEYIIQIALSMRRRFLPDPVCEDTNDDKFLACALASGAVVV